MIINTTCYREYLTLLLWLDPFQPASDWIGACYSMKEDEGSYDDMSVVITDGFGG